jgi:GntR family transcriptional regulator
VTVEHRERATKAVRCYEVKGRKSDCRWCHTHQPLTDSTTNRTSTASPSAIRFRRTLPITRSEWPGRPPRARIIGCMANRILQPPPIGATANKLRLWLLDQISSGVLRPGQRLGAERDLAVEFGVSRTSLREALGALEWEGAIRRVPGRKGGTFVATKVDRDLSRIVGVPSLLRDQGFTAGSKVIRTSIVTASQDSAERLQIEPGASVYDIVRIRLADATPISLEHVQLPAARFPDLLESPLGGSLYEILELRFGVKPAVAQENIEVVSATNDEALVLDVVSGSPLFSILRTSVDDQGVPFEYSHDLFRADRTRISIRTHGDGGITSAPNMARGVVGLSRHVL